MKQSLIRFVLGSTILLYSCTNNETTPSLEKIIIGNWKAVSEDGHQIAPEWGFVYEGSIKLYPDHSFAENVGPNTTNVFKMGTWELKNSNTSIIFYSVMNDQGTIKRDTSKFNISLDITGKMIWRNSHDLIRHIRVE